MTKSAQCFQSSNGPRTLVLGLLLTGALSFEISGAQIIDRMVAIVDGRVVTSSEVEDYRIMAAIFGDTLPEDRAELLEEVIENFLIQNEIDQFGQVRVGQDLVDHFIEQLDLSPDLQSEAVREAVRRRLQRINYFDARFRRFVVATEDEITEYYETVFLPAARARGLDVIPEVDEIRDQIRENVITEKTNRQVETWTDSLVRRSDVEIVAYVE